MRLSRSLLWAIRGALLALYEWVCEWVSLSASVLGQILEREEKRNTKHSWNQKQKKTKQNPRCWKQIEDVREHL